MKKRYSTFEDAWDIWGWVYGIPLVIGILLMLIGGLEAVLGALLVWSVAGSFLIISALDAMED